MTFPLVRKIRRRVPVGTNNREIKMATANFRLSTTPHGEKIAPLVITTAASSFVPYAASLTGVAKDREDVEGVSTNNRFQHVCRSTALSKLGASRESR